MKRWITVLLAAALMLGCLVLPASAESGFANFRTTAVYSEGQFSDVGPDDWYHDNVAAAYELGLMVGSDGSFDAAGSVTFAQSFTLAARLHSIYAGNGAEFVQGEPWYQVYLDYALEHGLLFRNVDGDLESQDPDAPVSRRLFAAILSRALPESALPEVNAVEDDAIPDVKLDDRYGAEIYRLYRAGILTGNDGYGTFAPESEIQRSAVAAIVTRMAYRSLRLKFALEKAVYPDLTKKTPLDDSAFANSALVGNSLAQGMRLFSGLKSMNFFDYQSTTVFDPNGFSPDRCFDKLLQGKYERVYMEYGINEIGYGPAMICEGYGQLIDRIRAAMPGVEIYVMAVTPVTAERSAQGNFTMTSIRALNAALHDMCREKECWFLDSCELLCDETGYLPAKYAGWDGSPHLAVAGYEAWADIIRSYY